MEKQFDWELLRKRLYSGLICDVLDYFGFRNQSFQAGFIPIKPDTVVFGYAYPVKSVKVDEMPENALVRQCQSIDDIKKDNVYVMAASDHEYPLGIWGEIMSVGVRARGGTGAIIDGMYRDTRQLLEMGFPVIGRGHLPTTSKGRAEILAWNVPVEIDGVHIEPGDLIFGDIDGVAVIPKNISEEVLERCAKIMGDENAVRNKIAAGASVAKTYLEIGAI
jgi:regulator of RNase E activity RraA